MSLVDSPSVFPAFGGEKPHSARPESAGPEDAASRHARGPDGGVRTDRCGRGPTDTAVRTASAGGALVAVSAISVRWAISGSAFRELGGRFFAGAEAEMAAVDAGSVSDLPEELHEIDREGASLALRIRLAAPVRISGVERTGASIASKTVALIGPRAGSGGSARVLRGAAWATDVRFAAERGSVPAALCAPITLLHVRAGTLLDMMLRMPDGGVDGLVSGAARVLYLSTDLHGALGIVPGTIDRGAVRMT